jgi:hypothetical protein
MAATKKFILHRVGEGGRNAASDVLAAQQLLVAAGTAEPGVAGGGWGKHSKNALSAFQKAQKLPLRDYIDPDDDCLLRMATVAQILIPIPDSNGGVGLKTLHNWFVDNKIKYETGADKAPGTRAFFGLDFQDSSDYAVQRNNGRYERGPVMMNCTTYVNLMISVFMSGDVHDLPYDADCSCFGATSNTHVARDRYGLALIYRDSTVHDKTKKENYFKTAEEIAASSKPKNLYVLEVAGGAQGGVSHMAILYDGEVYECTTGQPASACIKRPLETFVGTKHGKIFYMFGPRPG